MNIKPALLLLSLCHAGSAAALGLGELNVRSHLGQPLHATVNILGAGPSTAADCFSLDNSAGAAVSPPRAQLSLEQAGDQTRLHIRTTYAMNDPIAQFALISDCESRLRRDYVLLLDPPSMAAAAPDVPLVAAQEIVPRATPATSTPRPPLPGKIKREPSAPRPPVSSASKSSKRSTPAADAAPRLVLSGRHGLGSSALALRLDTNLPDLNRRPSDRLTPDELSDENTALTRKLAHLQTQLVALQQRNAELEARRNGGPANTAPPASRQPTQWPLILLMIGLLAGGGILTAWLRRGGSSRVSSRKTAWSSTSSEPEVDRMTADPWSKPAPERPEPPPKSERIIEFVPSNPEQSTEVKDDILDQAEVYMAHGHGDLAVHLLQEHLREAPDESPVPWLLLLDLLHREGDTESYAAASAECRHYFNVNLSGHSVSQDSEPGQGLEAYPHVLEQLMKVWGSPEIEDFFKDLVFDNRGGTRIGFEPGAYRDILLLRAIARDVEPLAA